MEINAAKLDALLSKELPKEGPGACLALLHEGRPVYQFIRGQASVENPAPLTAQSIFNVGSLAKQFTALSILMLQQQRKLNLEQEVRKYIPELPNYGKPLKLRHLLWHTSGLRCYTTLLWWGAVANRHDYSRKQALELACRQKELNFSPGQEYLYGNSNYLLLSEIVQRVSGRSIGEFCKAQIFGPLGMKATHFRERSVDPIPNLASGHFEEGGKLYVSRHLGAVAGVGRLMSSLEDFQKWERFFQEPGKRLPLLRLMLNQGWTDSGQKIRYGGGLMLQNYRGLSMVRHDGFTSGCRAEFCRFPEKKLTLVAMTNTTAISPTWLSRLVINTVLSKELQPVSALGPGQPPAPQPKAKLAASRLKELEGLYRGAGEGAFMELTATKTGLRGRSILNDISFLPESGSAFQGQGAGAIFRMDFTEDGGFILTKLGRASRYERVQLAQKLSEERLARFAGRYACPETLSRLEVKAGKGVLESYGAAGERAILKPSKGGHFYAFYLDYHFTSKGLVMSSQDGWVRRLKWVRL